MSQPGQVIAIFAANPALSSILAMVLASDRRLRVREFDNEISLIAYMRIAPVAVLVCDFDHAESPAPGLVATLRGDPAIADPSFQVIGLTRTVTPFMRKDSLAAGIDEVIVKPMSPRHLLQRVQSRLRSDRPFVRAAHYRGPDRRNRLPRAEQLTRHKRRFGDNVIELFPEQPAL